MRPMNVAGDPGVRQSPPLSTLSRAMSTLLDVLLTEQLVDAFRAAGRKNPDLNATLVPDPSGDADIVGDGGTAVRIDAVSGASLLVTSRGIAREVGARRDDVVSFRDLVGYDWISRDLSQKVVLQAEHYDRLYLLLRGAREVVLDRLGPSVYPLMAYLGKVLELRSQKLLLRRLDPDVVEVVSVCLQAAVHGPFFSDAELVELFEQDRPSLRVVASMWSRMNLASPDLARTVAGVMEMLLLRREGHPEAWGEWVGMSAERVRGALETFRAAVG